MTFKDNCNEKSNQTGKAGNVVHSSNLCTEIVEVTSDGEDSGVQPWFHQPQLVL